MSVSREVSSIHWEEPLHLNRKWQPSGYWEWPRLTEHKLDWPRQNFTWQCYTELAVRFTNPHISLNRGYVGVPAQRTLEPYSCSPTEAIDCQGRKWPLGSGRPKFESQLYGSPMPDVDELLNFPRPQLLICSVNAAIEIFSLGCRLKWDPTRRRHACFSRVYSVRALNPETFRLTAGASVTWLVEIQVQYNQSQPFFERYWIQCEIY